MEQRNSSSSRSGSSRESTGLADRVMYEQQCVYQYERDERKEWKQERVDGQQMLMMKQEEMQQKRFENDCKTNKTEQQCMSEWKQEQGDRHYHSRHHHRKNDEHGNGHTDRDDIHTRASELMMRFETLWERYGKKAKPSDTRSASLNKSETMTSWGNDFVKKSVVQQLFPPKGQLHAHNQSMQPIPQSDTSTKNSSQYTIKEKNEHAPQNTFDNMHQNNHDRNNLENFEPQNHLLKSVLTEFPQQQGSETDMSLPEHLYNSRTNILKEQTKTPEATFHSEDILPASFSRLWTGRRSDEYQNDQKNANYSVQANHDTYQGDVSQTRSSSKTNDYFTTEEDSDESVATYCIRTDHDDDEDDQSIKNRKIALSGLPEIRTISPTASYYTKETFDRNTMGSNRERSNNSTLYKTKWPDDIKSNVRQSNRNASQMDKQHTQNNLEYAATTIQSAWRGFVTRAADPHVAAVRREIRTRRIEDHILALHRETKLLRSELTREQELRSMQLEAMRVISDKVQALVHVVDAQQQRKYSRAAIVIQRHIRGWLARKKHRTVLDQRISNNMTLLARKRAAIVGGDSQTLRETVLELQDQIYALHTALENVVGIPTWKNTRSYIRTHKTL